MIPKIIHYCWFGPKPIDGELKQCMDSWGKFLPAYEVKCWNENNLPPDSDFLKLLIKYGKWALLSDYVRFYVLYYEGGLYFDTDIEVVKDFAPLLSESCFLGFQQKSLIKHPLNGAVLGAEPRHEYIKECLKMIIDSFYSKVKPLIGPMVVSNVAKQMGLTTYGEQYLGSVKILSLEAFYPYHWEEAFYPECVKESTFCIHRWQYSWKRKKNMRMLYKSAAYKFERILYIFKKRITGKKLRVE